MNSSERAREQRIAAEAEPEILESLAAGEELMDVAEAVARNHGIDEIKAYRWVVYIDEKRQKQRKRIAGIGLAFTWLGAILLLVGVMGVIFVAATAAWLAAIVVGGVVAIPSLTLALLSRKIAYSGR